MDCTQARDEFSALLDGELAPEERAAVESHLSLCSDCLRELDGLKRVDVFYRQLPVVTAPEGFEDRVRQGLRTRVLLRFPRRRPVWPYLAAAAGLGLVVGAAVVQFGLPSDRMRMASAPEADAPMAAPALGALEKGVELRRREAAPARGMAVANVPAAPMAGARLGDERQDKTQDFAADSALPPPEAPAPAPATPPPPMPAEEPVQVSALGAPVEDASSRDYAGATLPQATAETLSSEPPVPADAPPAEQETLEFYGLQTQASPAAESAPAPAAEEKAELDRALTDDKGTTPRKVVGARTFILREGVWKQDGYKDDEKTTKVVRGSEELRRIIDKHPDLAPAFDLGEHIVFKADGRWYRIVPQSSR